MNWRFLIFILFTVVGSAYAQLDSKEEEEGIDTKTLAYGLTTNNNSGLIGGLILRNSVSVGTYKGKPVNRYISVEVLNIKNPREKSDLSLYGGKFTYGKTNYFFSIRPQYGREVFFYSKDAENSIGFSMIVSAGPSFGLQKPYYIKYSNAKDQQVETVQYNPDIHTDPTLILGAGNILQNLFKNLKFNPGFHVKVASNFDISTFNDNVSGIELGTTFEVFSKRPEILAPKFSKNPQAFASLYLTLYFGNKKLLPKKKK
ncbi:MAG: hypothetical protein U0V04_11565 [Spirosomataceae bacterium]|jgi:hypothetical protein